MEDASSIAEFTQKAGVSETEAIAYTLAEDIANFRKVADAVTEVNARVSAVDAEAANRGTALLDLFQDSLASYSKDKPLVDTEGHLTKKGVLSKLCKAIHAMQPPLPGLMNKGRELQPTHVE